MTELSTIFSKVLQWTKEGYSLFREDQIQLLPPGETVNAKNLPPSRLKRFFVYTKYCEILILPKEFFLQTCFWETKP